MSCVALNIATIPCVAFLAGGVLQQWVADAHAQVSSLPLETETSGKHNHQTCEAFL